MIANFFRVKAPLLNLWDFGLELKIQLNISLLACNENDVAQATQVSRRAGQGWTRLLRFATKMVRIIVPTYGA